MLIENGIINQPLPLKTPGGNVNDMDNKHDEDMSWSSGDDSSYYSSDDSSSSEYTESDHMDCERENTVAPLLHNTTSTANRLNRCVGSTPHLSNMAQNVPNSFLERMQRADKAGRNSQMDHSYHPSTTRVTLKRQPSRVNGSRAKTVMPRSDSAPLVSLLGNAPDSLLARMRKAESVGIAPSTLRNAEMKLQERPQDHFINILKGRGIETTHFNAMEIENFFAKMTEDNIKAYTLEKTVAMRNDDVEALKEMHKRGELLQCSNQYGETILHTGCRRGSLACVRFLLQDVGLDPKVVDDYGRTVFHDICWTTKPVFELVEILLTICPDLMWVKDKRGFSPLTYVPKDCWEIWCDFLDKQADKLVLRQLGKSRC